MNRPKRYLNENLSWRIARSLCGYGYDAMPPQKDYNEEDISKKPAIEVLQK